MNRDELDQERPVPAAPAQLDTWRPASTESPLTLELSAIFGGIAADMVRRHIAESRARAIRDHLLTPAQLRALRANGIDLGEPDPLEL